MLTQALTNAGHSVVRWSSTFRHYTKDFRGREFTTHQYSDLLSFRFLAGPGYKMHRSPRRLIHHAIEARGFRERAPREERPDVVLATVPTLALAKVVAEFGTETGVPVILDVRDCWPDHYLVFLPALLRPVARPLLYHQYRTLRHTLQSASGVTAVSKAYLDWAHHRGRLPDPQHDRVFPIGYDWPKNERIDQPFTPYFAKSGMTPDDFIILFVGTFNTSFDLMTVLETAENAQKAGLNRVKFVLVGAGPYGKTIKERAEGMRNVAIIDWIQNQQELRNVLASASVGLCPYREKGSISLPNKPFEFMAAGKPLLSSLTGELWQLIEREKFGLNYKSSSADSLLASIKKMAGDKAALAQMAHRSRELFEERFESSKIYPEFSRFLEGFHKKYPTGKSLQPQK